MSSGAKVVTRYAPQPDVAVVPTTGWQTLLVTGNTLNTTVNMTASEAITDDRMANAGIPTRATVAGDIDAELQYGVLDDLISAAFMSDWATDVLSVGSTKKMFAIEKSFTDINVNHLFKGCHVGAFSLEIPEEGKIMAKFTFAGLGYDVSKTASFATTPAAADDTLPLMSNVSVGDVLIDGVAQTGIACVTAFSFSLDNGLQQQTCLGKGLYVGAQIATEAAITGSVTLAYSAASHDSWAKSLTGQELGFEIPITDADGNQYVLEIPAAQVTGDIPNGGKNDLLQLTLEYTAVRVSPTITRIPA
ncbi:MAG: phage tail tube protein [Pseudomonadota bacterium]|nr:phage tail tube protein [Pseudomonadota bacterium]